MTPESRRNESGFSVEQQERIDKRTAELAKRLEPLRSWEFADEKIADLRDKIAAAERGEYDGNPEVMRDTLNAWLEYRHAHGPDDERLPL